MNRDRQKVHVQNETSAGVNLLTDTLTVRTIRNFLSDEHKPHDLEPVDLLFMVYLMLRKAEDGGIQDSQQTLARRFGCSVKTIWRSQNRLKSKSNSEYIACVRRIGRTSEVSLNVENIPAEKPLRLLLSEEATQLAAWYKGELQKRHRKKFPKRFTDQNTATAQRILNDCGGNVDLAKRLLEFALDPGMFRKAAMNGLYKLFERWPKVKNSYRARNPETPPMPEPQSVPEPAPTVANLTKAVVRKFNLNSTEEAAWQATLQRLSDAGNSAVQLHAVLKYIATEMPDGMRAGGAAGFEKHFSGFSELMQQAEQQPKEVSA